MKIWREPLPINMLPILWHNNLIKIIDSVHLHNHRWDSCKRDLNPSILKKVMPNGNMMEETFAWLSRYKKILNVLPKHRFEFMLHRLVVHRNKYTEYCHKMKKYPLLPTLKLKKPNDLFDFSFVTICAYFFKFMQIIYLLLENVDVT